MTTARPRSQWTPANFMLLYLDPTDNGDEPAGYLAHPVGLTATG